jgi:hypothetical protein
MYAVINDEISKLWALAFRNLLGNAYKEDVSITSNILDFLLPIPLTSCLSIAYTTQFESDLTNRKLP